MINTKIDIKVVSKGGKVRKLPPLTNIFTNRGASAFNVGGFGSSISLGVGVQPEVPDTNSLQSPKITRGGNWANIKRNDKNIANNTIKNIQRLSVGFPEESSDVIYTELGIVAASGGLSTYTLIKDIEGNPASVTVLKGEKVEIEYTIEYSFPYRLDFLTEGDNASEGFVIFYNLPLLSAVPDSYNSSYGVHVGTATTEELLAGYIPNDFKKVDQSEQTKKVNVLRGFIRSNMVRPVEKYNTVQLRPYNTDQHFGVVFHFKDELGFIKENSYEYKILIPFIEQ